MSDFILIHCEKCGKPLPDVGIWESLCSIIIKEASPIPEGVVHDDRCSCNDQAK